MCHEAAVQGWILGELVIVLAAQGLGVAPLPHFVQQVWKVDTLAHILNPYEGNTLNHMSH